MRAIFLIFVGLLHASSATAQEPLVWGQGVWGENVWASDRDNDMIPDLEDAYPLVAIGSLLDTDNDGAPDDCDQACVDSGMGADADDDGDGVADTSDAFPLDATESIDTDGDGIGNKADTDDDNDGYTDQHELEMGSDPLDSGDMPMSGGLILVILNEVLSKASK